MDVQLIIDSREPLICLHCFNNNYCSVEELNLHIKNCVVSGLPFKFHYQKLPVGDYIFVQNVNGIKKVVPFLFERKKLNDFVSSCKKSNKNRLNKQSFVMNLFSGFKKVFILEGNQNDLNNKIKNNNNKNNINLYHARLSELSFVYHYDIIPVSKYSEMTQLFVMYYNQINNLDSSTWLNVKEFYFCDNNIRLLYHQNELLYKIMICIPGVSTKIANQIVFVYQSIENLILKYENYKDKCLMLFEKCKHKNKSVVNKKLSAKIYFYLFNKKLN